jgi:TatD DNase family protein
MEFIDSHCHLEMPHFDEDRDAVIQRAKEAGVTRMITVATNLGDAKKAAQIANGATGVFLALGLHPHDARTASEDVWKEMNELARGPKVVAWGEIGLDYHYDHSPRHIQRSVFAEQIYIARELGLPIIIHTREANNDTLGVLENEADGPYSGVVHCFGGDLAMAERVLDMGFKISFTGTITFRKNLQTHEVIRYVGLDNILIETDSPYLTPIPHRGKRNEPAHVALVARHLAEIMGAPLETVAEKMWQNTCGVFKRLS